MEIWIISESDSLASSVCKSLAQLSIDCPMSRVLTSESIDQLVSEWAGDGQVVFFAARALTPHHMESLQKFQAAGSKALAVVTTVSDHSMVLRAIRAGATDVLSAGGNLDEEIEGFLSRLQMERGQRSTKGRLITVVPCYVPGDGNLLSVNIAAAIAKSVGSCALLDFHLRGGELALLLKAKPRHTVLDLLKQQQTVDEVMFQQALTQHESGIRLLAGPPLFSDLRGIDPQACQRLLSLAQASHPFVVVSSEDIVHAEQIKALAVSNQIVLAMRPEIVSLHRAAQYVEFMTRNHVAPANLHVLAIGTGYAGEIPLKTIRDVLGIPSVHAVPDDPTAMNMSINVGNPLVLESPKSRTSRAIAQFVETLTDGPGARATDRPPTLFARAATVLALNTLAWAK